MVVHLRWQGKLPTFTTIWLCSSSEMLSLIKNYKQEACSLPKDQRETTYSSCEGAQVEGRFFHVFSLRYYPVSCQFCARELI